jgi:hypothetical protein
MPAKYPRLTITMRPGLHAMLRRLSELTGQSQSALIFELLDGAEPVLARVIRLLEAATVAKDELRGKLSQEMHSAQERIEHQLAISLDAVGEHDVGELLADAEGPRRRRRKGSGAARSSDAAGHADRPQADPTPMSNRGVRSLTYPTKVVSLRRGK